jgi:hypothetical protein
MEFSIPWQNWNVNNVQYGIRQTNTRIEDGLFIPLYYNERYIRCQALHLYTPELHLKEILSLATGTYAVLEIDKAVDGPFCEKIADFELQNKNIADKNKSVWWQDSSANYIYKTAFTETPTSILWQLQIPDSGIFSCYDTSRKSWYASNEDGLKERNWRVLARTSGIWVDKTSYGIDWKIIGAFV